jgi:hypothetical protein
MLNCVLVLAAAAAAGCGNGDGLLRTRGQVVKGGENFVTPEGQHLQIEFVPIPEDGKPPKMYYWAEVDQETGEFRPDGPMKTGMPPGKYRVALVLMDKKKKDIFGGKFNTEHSPYIFEVDADTDELIVDLDDPPEIQLPSMTAAEIANNTGD